MGRRKKGRDISGWIVLDKPSGVTSTAMVNKVRWALDAKKAGHAGTLDPDATGLLAIALGEATKTIPFITDAMKAYEFQVTWGQATSTDDASGAVIAESQVRPTAEQITSALPAFIGQIEQVPPQVSAVKVDGQRAYDLAREGEEMELAARPLWVEALSLRGVSDADTADFELVCGKGGYVRSIARDLGQVLGCFGHVAHLRRIWSGPFDLDSAVTLDDIERTARTPEADTLLRPLEDGLADLPRATCSADAAMRLRHGNPAHVVPIEKVDYGETIWAAEAGQAVAIGRYMGGELAPSRVFVS